MFDIDFAGGMKTFENSTRTYELFELACPKQKPAEKLQAT
jgi:hypothetical protein